jgi:hypothetical protein
VRRLVLLAVFGLALVWAQFRESGVPDLHARLELVIDPLMPARVYLFKDNQPFRLSPIQAMMPLHVDRFYRERMWTNSPSPDTLEVTCAEQSHFFLLKGQGTYNLPQGRYRVEAYRGLFYTPATAEFELRAGESKRISLKLEDWTGGASKEWISGDDHIHLTRERKDDDVFLGWLQAEDLSVGNFLQLQRQMDAAVQYAFGSKGEARRAGYSIRPGHESRSQIFGHIAILGGRELIRPLSVGADLSNAVELYPFPSVLFAQGRRAGATVGFAHFNGSAPHSTMLMDLTLGGIDFLEVFQFGELKTREWYELLNAGFQITAIAGSDFPVPLNRQKPWPRWLPLLGPERTLVKARATGSPYEAWAAGIRSGNVVISNGPLLEMQVDKASGSATATASFYRPLTNVEIVSNGAVIASVPGDGKRIKLTVSTPIKCNGSCWVAARTAAPKNAGEPDILAHTNPVYLPADGKPVPVRAARESLAKQWEAELGWYKSAQLSFADEARRREFFERGERTLIELRKPLGGAVAGYLDGPSAVGPKLSIK